MHHNVDTSTLCLVVRQRISQFRIHNGKLAAGKVVTVSAFQPAIFICDYRGITHLTSGSSNCKDGADRKTGRSRSFFLIKIPNVSIVSNSITDSLSGIDYTASADGQNKVCLFPAAKVYSFIDFGKTGIWNDAA